MCRCSPKLAGTEREFKQGPYGEKPLGRVTKRDLTIQDFLARGQRCTALAQRRPFKDSGSGPKEKTGYTRQLTPACAFAVCKKTNLIVP